MVESASVSAFAEKNLVAEIAGKTGVFAAAAAETKTRLVASTLDAMTEAIVCVCMCMCVCDDCCAVPVYLCSLLRAIVTTTFAVAV